MEEYKGCLFWILVIVVNCFWYGVTQSFWGWLLLGGINTFLLMALFGYIGMRDNIEDKFYL